MGKFAGIDLGKEELSYHVVNASGGTVKRGRAAATPQAAREVLSGLDLDGVGVEAGPYGSWLVEGLCRDGLPGVLIETRRMKQFGQYSKIKTDARDAERIAQAMRCGLYTAVHVKSVSSRQARTLLRARATLSRARVELQNSARGLLKEYGVKLKRQSSRLLEEAVREALRNLPEAVAVAVLPIVTGITELRRQQARLDREVRRLAKADPVSRLLMTTPGVGPVVGLAYRATLDDPHRFSASELVGPYLGLTPAKYASGETDYDGSITRQGDKMARAYLFEAATVILGRLRRPCALRDWGLALAERRGRRRATVAVARKLAVVMHRIWVTGQPFDWERLAAKPSA
jgi:transposase